MCLLTDPVRKAESDNTSIISGPNIADASQTSHAYTTGPSAMYTPETSHPYITGQGGERLSVNGLTDIIRDKGNDLTWEDFGDFEHYDIGSGLYIWYVPVCEGEYYIMIGGGSLYTDPMYVRLIRLSPEDKISGDYIDLFDDYIDLLDENTDVGCFFMDNFGIETQPHTWFYNPLVSSVFPAFAVDVDIRYSAIDVSVDSGSLYLHDSGTTQSLGETHTYNFGETIYWSPNSKDLYESGEATISDVADYCTLSFSIKNGKGGVITGGKLVIEKFACSNDGYSGFEYQIWMAEADPRLRFEADSVPGGWDGFVLSLND